MKEESSYLNNRKPEIFAFLLIIFGTPMISMIGLDFFNNRYIAVPYILLVGIGYLLMKREERKEINHERISTN